MEIGGNWICGCVQITKTNLPRIMGENDYSQYYMTPKRHIALKHCSKSTEVMNIN